MARVPLITRMLFVKGLRKRNVEADSVQNREASEQVIAALAPMPLKLAKIRFNSVALIVLAVLHARGSVPDTVWRCEIKNHGPELSIYARTHLFALPTFLGQGCNQLPRR